MLIVVTVMMLGIIHYQLITTFDERSLWKTVGFLSFADGWYGFLLYMFRHDLRHRVAL